MQASPAPGSPRIGWLSTTGPAGALPWCPGADQVRVSGGRLRSAPGAGRADAPGVRPAGDGERALRRDGQPGQPGANAPVRYLPHPREPGPSPTLPTH